jgi:hypothetical protein
MISEKFKSLYGLKVFIHLRTTEVTLQTEEDTYGSTSTVYGYIIDVDNKFVYVGHEMTDYNLVVSIDDIGVIQVDDEYVYSDDEEVH